MKVNKTKKRDDAWNFVCNCYDHHPGDTNEEKTEIKMSEYRSECRIGNWLLFTHHYPARCFGMNMPKSRDIQVNIPKNHSKRELTNGYRIRRGAIDHNIPLITNARLASAFIEAFCDLKLEDIQIKSWQEYK